MKSELEIQNRSDDLKLESQKISSQIYEVVAKLKEIPDGVNYENLRKPLIKKKESLHVLLGLNNSRWAETLWILDK